jgi:hypothetical protein
LIGVTSTNRAGAKGISDKLSFVFLGGGFFSGLDFKGLFLVYRFGRAISPRITYKFGRIVSPKIVYRFGRASGPKAPPPNCRVSLLTVRLAS